MSKRPAYYNDNDPFVIAQLKILIKEGMIADGEVDSRPIQEVDAKDLKGFGQVHLFAGIGAWSLALWLAEYPDEMPVWSCSCPCPPFSTAGKRKLCPQCQGENLIACPARTGFFICCSCSHAWLADPRHLLPEVWRLIRDARPDCPVFGEQVASETGRDWLAMLRSSMEILAYDTWSADLCSAGVGKDHIRQRLGWVAYAEGDHGRRKLEEERERRRARGLAGGREAGRLAITESGRRGERRDQAQQGEGGYADRSREATERLGDSGLPRSARQREERREAAGQEELRSRSGGSGRNAGGLEHADRGGRDKGKQASPADRDGSSPRSASGPGRMANSADRQLPKSERGSQGRDGSGPIGADYSSVGLGYSYRPGLERWRNFFSEHAGQRYIGMPSTPILCGDGKWRRVPANERGEPEPALFPLADAGSFRNRVGVLRGAGNTIDPQLFKEFIQAAREAIGF